MKQPMNLLLCCLLSGLLFNCQSPPPPAQLASEQSGDFQGSSQHLGQGSWLLKLDYEVESLTRILPLGGGPDTAIADLVAQVPQIGRQRVELYLYADGSFELTTEAMTPSQDFSVAHESLPNPTPPAVKTIWANGVMTLYDQAGERLAAHDVAMPLLTQVVERINEAKEAHSAEVINQALLSMQTQAYADSLQAWLDDPAAYGITLTPLSAEVVSLSLPASQAGYAEDGGEVVLLVDVPRNLLLASRLYDAQGALKVGSMYQYAESGPPYLTAMLHELTDVLPSGQAAVMETQQTFANLNLEIQ